VRALLDVSLLLALFDVDHSHHPDAGRWWAADRRHGWASCPLSQNGFVRIISGSGYPRRLLTAEAVVLLEKQIELGNHQFWSDDLSIVDPEVFDHSYILGPKQLTDVYLLALAVKNGGRLVTFDRSIPLRAVRGAEAHHVVVL
jgi:hypothetical protein